MAAERKVTLTLDFKVEKEQLKAVSNLFNQDFSKNVSGSRATDYLKSVKAAANDAFQAIMPLIKTLSQPLISKEQAKQAANNIDSAFKDIDNRLLSLQGNISKTFGSVGNAEALKQIRELGKAIDEILGGYIEGKIAVLPHHRQSVGTIAAERWSTPQLLELQPIGDIRYGSACHCTHRHTGLQHTQQTQHNLQQRPYAGVDGLIDGNGTIAVHAVEQGRIDTRGATEKDHRRYEQHHPAQLRKVARQRAREPQHKRHREQQQRYQRVEPQRGTRNIVSLRVAAGHHHRHLVFQRREDNQHLDVRVKDVVEAIVVGREDAHQDKIGRQRDALCQHIAAEQRSCLFQYGRCLHNTP